MSAGNSRQGEQGETILLVEDDKDVRTYLSDALRGLQYRVLSAANATIALKLLAEDQLRIDILLTDIVMPGMNGRELGKKATQLRPPLKVLYMTGYSRNAVVHHGRLDQGVDLLQKPISTQVLAVASTRYVRLVPVCLWHLADILLAGLDVRS